MEDEMFMKFYRGVTTSGHCLHLSEGPKHSAGKVPALCGSMVILDLPLTETTVTTCSRCRKLVR